MVREQVNQEIREQEVKADIKLQGLCGVQQLYTLYSNGLLVLDHTDEESENFEFFSEHCLSPFRNSQAINCLNAAEGVKCIGGGLFRGCDKLQTLTLPDSLDSIGMLAFMECAIKEIRIPKNVRYIGERAFYDCNNLETVELSESLQSIGSSAFNNCNRLKRIEIPAKVETIASQTFFYCHNLEEVEIRGGKLIDSWAFFKCSNLQDLRLLGETETINDYAFCSCYNLSSVELPKTLKFIGTNAFSGCALTEIKIPESVEKIGANAFGYSYNSEDRELIKQEDFRIYGVKGTVAEQYAQENGFVFYSI